MWSKLLLYPSEEQIHGKLLVGEETPPPVSPSLKSESSLNISDIPNLDGNDSIISNHTNQSQFDKIPVHVSNYRVFQERAQFKSKQNYNNLKTIKRSNRTLQALNLPTVINLNPRLVYNKRD